MTNEPLNADLRWPWPRLLAVPLLFVAGCSPRAALDTESLATKNAAAAAANSATQQDVAA